MEDFLALGVTSQIHYLSIKRGIQVLRQSKLNYLIRSRFLFVA
jgi:hypothetical protein